MEKLEIELVTLLPVVVVKWDSLNKINNIGLLQKLFDNTTI